MSARPQLFHARLVTTPDEKIHRLRGLFGNLEIGSEVDCELGDGIRERFEDPTSLAMLGLVVTVGATLLQMLRGN